MTRISTWAGAGILLIAAWAVIPNTTWFIAYRGGDLARVHALCNSGIGEFAQAMNHTAATSCASVDSTYAWVNIAGIAGLVCLAIAGWLWWRAAHPKQAGNQPAA